MKAFAVRCVARAKELEWSIVVGEADGIDATVIAECDRIGVPVEVHGAYGKLRHQSKFGQNIAHDCSYPGRDHIMAGLCDVCQAVWDGKSRGTKLTYDIALELGKKAHIKSF
jgi:hypothetical protein